MKKQLRTLILLVVAVAVLAGAYFAIRGIQARRQAEEEQAAQDDVQYLYEPDTIATLVLTNSSGTYAYDYSDFKGTWTYHDDAAYELDKESLDKFANELMQSRILRTLEITDGLDAYGLENPAYVMELTDAEGGSCTLYFGSQSGDGENYYVMRNDDGVIYNVSTNLYLYLDNTVLNYVVYDQPETTDISAVESIQLTYGGHTCTLNKITEIETKTITGMDGKPQEEQTEVYSWQVETDVPGYTGINDDIQESVDAVVELITKKGVKFTGCVDFDADEATMKSYGLDGSFALQVNVAADAQPAEGESEPPVSWAWTIGRDNLTYNDRGDILTGWYYANLDGALPVVQMNYTGVSVLTALFDALAGEAAE